MGNVLIRQLRSRLRQGNKGKRGQRGFRIVTKGFQGGQRGLRIVTWGGVRVVKGGFTHTFSE